MPGPGRILAVAASTLVGWLLIANAAPAGEADIRTRLREYFATDSPEQRAVLATEIAADEAYQPEKVGDWLHGAELFTPHAPGRALLTAAITGGSRQVVLRVPRGYDANRPYPLLYALHGSGGDGDSIIAYAEKLFGARIEEFAVAAPTAYAEFELKPTSETAPEHRAILREVRKTLHVDAGRQYALGYSRGGHATWTLAVTIGDEFAACVPLAGTLIIPEYDQLYSTFLENLRGARLACYWGAQDTAGPDLQTASSDGGIAGLNRQIRKLADAAGIALQMVEYPDKGHGDVWPPLGEVGTLCSARRDAAPRRVKHAFRAIDAAGAHWLEGLRWHGEQWDQRPLKLRFQPGESDLDPAAERAAVGRAVRGLLGELSGEINGQELRVSRKRVSELMIWFSDGLIDWNAPVSIKVSGSKVHEGVIRRELAVCLSEAARSYDFDRLRWAGLHFRSGQKPRWVSGPAAARPERTRP